MSKGDNVRPHNKKRYDENFEAAFGKKELKTWNPKEDKPFFEGLAELDKIIDEANEQIEVGYFQKTIDNHKGPYWSAPGYRGEWSCPHGIGHGNHIHGCDGCCERDDYPGRETK